MDSRKRFIEKARTWPRVETADQLARLLSGVKPGRWREYSYVANPPCHASSSKKSFTFGDSPGGGLVVYCWACEGETVEQAENALGVALQVRRQDGSLRYRDGRTGQSRRPLPSPAQPQEPQRLHATPLGEGVTVGDFFATRHWLLSKGKGKPATARGGRAAWRQSRELNRGGILLARHGGVVQEVDGNGRPYQLRILPWESYDRILELRNDPALGVGRDAEPMVSLAGDANTPCLSDYLLLDMDYHPEQDPQRVSAPVRDTVAQRLAATGAALYYSRSGNGYHAIVRLAVADIEAGLRPRRKRAAPGQLPGLAFDLFLPGDKSPLNLSRERPMANTDPGHVLPIFTLNELDGVLRGEERGEVSYYLDEARQRANEPEYAVLLLQVAQELADEGQATEAELERLERAKQYFAEVMQ